MLEQNGLAMLNRGGLIPALNLSFIGEEVLNPRITFTRASGATRFNKNGLLEVVGNDVPRLNYDPTSPAGTAGVEKIVNGNFIAGSFGWSAFGTAGNVTFIEGAVRINSIDGLISGIVQNGILTNGRRYSLTFNLISTTGLGVSINNNGVDTYATYTTPGIKTVQFTANGSSIQWKRTGGIVDAYITGISILEATFAPKGLLIEESRTNSALNSGDISNVGYWSSTTGSTISTAISCPDGSTLGYKLVEDTSTGVHTRGKSSIALTSDGPVTATMFVKAGGRSLFRLEISGTGGSGARGFFDVANGVTVSSVAYIGAPVGTLGTQSIQDVGNGWYRCQLTMTPGAAGSTAYSMLLSMIDTGVNVSYTGNGTSGLHVWGMQLEAGAFPTSYIPTTTAAVTRAADIAAMTGTNFSSWYNQTQGTFVASGVWDNAPDLTSPQLLIQVDNGTSVERMFLRRQTAGLSNFDIAVASVFQGITSPTPNIITTGAVIKVGIAYSAAATSTSLGASALGVSGAKPLPTVTQMTLGSALSSAYLNGHIRSITYYNTKLLDAQLQALTL